MFVDLVVTFAIAAMVSLLFLRLLVWRPRGHDEISPEPLFLFVIVWLVSWTLGRWIIPIGPMFWGAPVLTFTFLAFLVGLIIAATVSRPSRPTEVPAPAPTSVRAANVVFGLFFWVAILMLALALVAAYAVER